MNHTSMRRRSRARQHGFTMIELSVAILIALFLLVGLYTILQGTSHTSTNQNLLAQLQDDERVATTMMTDVIQSAGYFPDAATNPFATALPAAGAFTTVGQVVTGGANPSGTGGDIITVRFQTDPGDGVLNCLGTSNSTGGRHIFINTFSINTQGQLVCELDNSGNKVPLASGIQSLQIFYGVSSASTLTNATDGQVDAYLPASQMTATNWTNVYSVKMQITFTNPLNGQPGQSPTITFSRVVGIMSRIGVNVVDYT